MPRVGSNENAAARRIKSLSNNAHLMCQLLFTLILLTHTKEKSCNILFSESAANSFARLQPAYSELAHGHSLFFPGRRFTWGLVSCWGVYYSVERVLKVFCGFIKTNLTEGQRFCSSIPFFLDVTEKKREAWPLLFFSLEKTSTRARSNSLSAWSLSGMAQCLTSSIWTTDVLSSL